MGPARSHAHPSRGDTIRGSLYPRPKETPIASDRIQSWVYTEDFADSQDTALALATGRAEEFGLAAVSAGAGATLRMIAGLLGATAVAEIGTGTGVTGLWLLAGMDPEGILTTIDDEVEHQRTAKEVFTEAGIKSTRTRTISGRAHEVLPRLADAAYDLVVLSSMPTDATDYVEPALRLLRPGGALVVLDALWFDRVADPARRDEQTVAMRVLGKSLRDNETLQTALLPAGNGILTAVKR